MIYVYQCPSSIVTTYIPVPKCNCPFLGFTAGSLNPCWPHTWPLAYHSRSLFFWVTSMKVTALLNISWAPLGNVITLWCYLKALELQCDFAQAWHMCLSGLIIEPFDSLYLFPTFLGAAFPHWHNALMWFPDGPAVTILLSDLRNIRDCEARPGLQLQCTWRSHAA